MDDSAELPEISKIDKFYIESDGRGDIFFACSEPWCRWDIEVTDGIELRELTSGALYHWKERHASD